MVTMVPAATMPVGAAFDDLGVLEDVLELADPALHVPLLVLGGVVVAVLGQIAELAGALDLLGDLDPPAGGEIVEFGGQAFVRRAGQLVGCHGADILPAGRRPSRSHTGRFRAAA